MVLLLLPPLPVRDCLRGLEGELIGLVLMMFAAFLFPPINPIDNTDAEVDQMDDELLVEESSDIRSEVEAVEVEEGELVKAEAREVEQSRNFFPFISNNPPLLLPLVVALLLLVLLLLPSLFT
eukprot:CAMPEP_0173145384 /NCGR_PEP_ID=MMETSP1105-20130129/7801_1 /TAXON_ID=2985 /ORGANISM="Ochromonas sp., Strain BG-1" /LENGTH=122 /DNA_ID=CAMNT_0014059255 /DNA_START=148 /DNA_END=516 /DNA_ORIENTATION=+